MLINCPECSKQISDKCGNCPNCGYPIEVQEILYEYEGRQYNIKDIVETIKKYDGNGSYSKIYDIIENVFNLTNPTIGEILKINNDIIEKYAPEQIEHCIYFDEEKRKKKQDILEQQKQNININNQPKCPTCNSTNISRISTTSKVVNVAMFGLLGQKRKHQFKCNNCKYEW